MSQILIQNLIRQLNEIQNGSLWFDQSFEEKLAPLTEKQVFKRPNPQIHSIAEQISHILAWRRECLLRFEGRRTELMDSPEDWKTNKELAPLGWEQLKKELSSTKQALIDLISGEDDEFLKTKFQDNAYDYHYLIEGIIQHDIYHMGQIGLAIKLLNKP